MSTGRNFNEVLRLLDSCQLTAGYKVATPVNWTQGEDVIIVPSVPDEEARTLFPDGWQAVTPYMRVVPQPGGEDNPVARPVSETAHVELSTTFIINFNETVSAV